MRKGKRVIVPGDGTSLWEITHNSDFARGFVGLLGNEKAIGESFHITSGEVMTWDMVIKQIADVLGLPLKTTHISSEFILAFLPDQLGNLMGDKAVSAVFDNSKLKRFVPDFEAMVTFKDGIAQSIAYFEAHLELQVVDEGYEKMMDRIIEAHDTGMRMAVERRI